MCVAVLVETITGPTLKELRAMERKNPHGAGLAWSEGNSIRYVKGLTAKQVWEILPTIPRPALLHFRWATHGPKVPHLTHPFPCDERAITSKELTGVAASVLIHNGVWTDYWKHFPDAMWVDEETGEIADPSDTAVAAYVVGTTGPEILDHVDWATAHGVAAGNGRMDVTLRGRWTEHCCNLYSNLNWYRSTKRQWSAFPSGSIYEYEPTIDEVLYAQSSRQEVIDWCREYEASQRVLRKRDLVRK